MEKSFSRRGFLGGLGATLALAVSGCSTISGPAPAPARNPVMASNLLATLKGLPRSAVDLSQGDACQVVKMGVAEQDMCYQRPELFGSSRSSVIQYASGLRVGSIIADKDENTLYFVDSPSTVMAFDAAMGKAATQTPETSFSILRKHILGDGMITSLTASSGVGALHLTDNGKPSGDKGYSIHGTNRPELLGQDVSAGCIRVSNWAILYILARTSVGMPVTVSRSSGSGMAQHNAGTTPRPAVS